LKVYTHTMAETKREDFVIWHFCNQVFSMIFQHNSLWLVRIIPWITLNQSWRFDLLVRMFNRFNPIDDLWNKVCFSGQRSKLSSLTIWCNLLQDELWRVRFFVFRKTGGWESVVDGNVRIPLFA
jgi:hypothetical protein